MKEIEKLVDRLFRQKWQLFDSSNQKSLPKDPGVYVLGYERKNMRGQLVKPKDIFYVGLANGKGGLRNRLYQFSRGIRVGGSHSGAMRFYREYPTDVPYNEKKRAGKKFWIAYLDLPCNVKKESRTSSDLRIMGKVTCLEYFVLARVRQKMQREPRLNKK